MSLVHLSEKIANHSPRELRPEYSQWRPCSRFCICAPQPKILGSDVLYVLQRTNGLRLQISPDQGKVEPRKRKRGSVITTPPQCGKKQFCVPPFRSAIGVYQIFYVSRLSTFTGLPLLAARGKEVLKYERMFLGSILLYLCLFGGAV